MSDSRYGKQSRRSLVVVAAVSAVTAVVVVTVIGIRTLAGSRSFFRDCQAIQDRGTPFRTAFSHQTDGRERRCTVMLAPVLVDPELADAAAPPELSNDDEVFAALTESIPGEGDEMGTEGLAVAHFLVDETGAVQRRRIAESSGSRAMDDAVLAIGPLSSFSPVETGDGPVEAWVALTVGFRTDQSALQALEALRRKLRPGVE
ncbi:MAG: TonB family protein [Gemmatimonadota bacterium]|nr:TonB family protein [Gemmatimonadota bacterium]MDE2872476.1 TonB family protein [Gemmatimonadota bacterium]